MNITCSIVESTGHIPIRASTITYFLFTLSWVAAHQVLTFLGEATSLIN